jgi:hypothetical protein
MRFKCKKRIKKKLFFGQFLRKKKATYGLYLKYQQILKSAVKELAMISTIVEKKWAQFFHRFFHKSP